jgi:CPA2 family monovalent cation:H+ antiporter-2
MHGLILDLAIVTVVAAVTGLLARRFGQPSILGYLFAGLIVGPYIPIPVFADPQRMSELAEVGVVLVMFAIGLEFRVRRLMVVLPVSGLAAAAQIGALFVAGFTVGSVLGWSTGGAVTLGATLSISSTMVVSAVLRTRPVDADIRSHVFGILVVQDVVAIVLISVVTALASGETLELRSLGIMIAQLVAVVASMLMVSMLILPRVIRYALERNESDVVVVLATAAAFGLALVASVFGYSVALGAFIAGMAVAESGRGETVEELIEPLRALFSGIFFVSIGMTVDPLVAWSSLPLALVLCAIVIVLQLVSVSFATVLTGSSIRRGVYSGLALGQIGELSFILATIAIAGGLVPEETMPALVTVATLTVFTTPLLLGRAQSVVTMLDRVIPDRIHNALTDYHSFLRSPRSDSPSSWRRPTTGVILDWFALLIVFVVRGTLLPRVDESYVLALNVGAVVVAAPFLVGLLRSSLLLVSNGRTSIRERHLDKARSRAIEAFGLLAVILAIGLPTLAIVSPLVEGPWPAVVVSAIVLAVLVYLGLRIGRLRGAYTSGVARLAIEVAHRAGNEEEDGQASLGHSQEFEAISSPGPLKGINYHPFAIEAGSQADGATLADLDLRCRSGATVVAVCRGAETTTLPTGHEPLAANDVLALSGSPVAVQLACEILAGVANDG